MNNKKRKISKEEEFYIAIKTAEDTYKERFSWEVFKTRFPYAKDQEIEIDSSEEMTADQKARRKASLRAGYAYSYYVKNPNIKTLDDFVLELLLEG